MPCGAVSVGMTVTVWGVSSWTCLAVRITLELLGSTISSL